MTNDESRKAFEKFISLPPIEKSIDRLPENDNEWPGGYIDYNVYIAWNSWQAAVEWAWTHPPHEFICARCMLRQDNVHQTKGQF